MSEISKGALTSENNNSFPNNNTGYITPTILRTFNQNMIDSLVDEISYTADSASFSSSIAQLQSFSSSLDATFATDAQLTALSASIATTDLAQSSSIAALQQFSSSLDATYVTDSAFNTYTASQTVESASFNQRIDSLDPSGSAAAIASLNAYTASNDVKWNNLGNQTGSYVTEAESGSFLITASFNNSNRDLTFTKGDGSQFAVNIPDVSGSAGDFVTTSSFNSYTASASTAVTASINAATQSLSASIAVTTNNLDLEVNGKLDSSSFNSYTQSNDSKVNSLISATGSYITSAQTASMTVLSASFAQTASFALTSSEARNVVIIARNGNASTLPAGTVVHITSASGDNPIFNTASYDTELLSANTLGMLRTPATSGADVEVLVNGIVTGVDTDPANGFVAGDIIYLGPTGSFTRVQPQAPNQIVTIGQVLRAQQNNGSVYVSINNGWELNELHNVAINSVADGDLLVYRSGESLWTNSSSAELGLVNSSSFNQFTASAATTGSNTFTGNQTINGTLRVNSPTASNESQIDYIKLPTFVGSNGTTYTTANLSLGDYASSAIDQTFFIEFGNSSFEKYSSLYVGPSRTQFIVGTGTGYDYDVIELLDNNNNTTTAKVKADTVILQGATQVTGSLLLRSGSQYNLSNNTTVNPTLYLSESVGGSTNWIRGWGEDPQSGGVGATQANYTGSVRITGSNNIVSIPQVRAGYFGGATAEMTGYISGSNNIINSNVAGIFLNSSSLLLPKTSGNTLGVNSSIIMTFTTSSLSGGHPIFNNNTINGGGFVINHPSGTLNGSVNSLIGGTITSSQAFVTNVRPTISGNQIWNSLSTLRHISGSITYNTNLANSNVLIENHMSSSGISNNGLLFSNNSIFGGSSNTGLGVYVSGSQSSNATRNIIDNLIGGKNIIVSSSFVSSSNSSLLSSLIYGQGLAVNANHGTSTGGTAFVGRFNNTGSNLGNANDIVFAVGTGTGPTVRKTGLWIDSGSVTNINGGLTLSGSSTITDGEMGFYNNIPDGNAIRVYSGSVEITSPQGTGRFYSNLPMTSSGLRINGTGLLGDLIVSGVFSGNSSLQVLGNSSFTGSVFTSASVNGVVNPLTISSNTASLDFSKGNFFTVQLVSGSTTHINPTNVKAGQTINVRVNTTGSALVTFQSIVKQPSGSNYIPTTATGVDVLTLVTFDTTDVYVANVKNFI